MEVSRNLTIADIKEYFVELIDPRADDQFMGSSLYPTLGLVAWYLIMVKYILPAYMKNRPPYSLTSVLFSYNLFQIIVSAYLVYMNFYASGYGRKFSFLKCRELDLSSTDPYARAGMQAIHYYYLTKFTEFLDTFFFLLRKKDNQVSFLHIYHHATMPINAWLALKFAAGGSSLIATGTNSLIHVVMYTYYFLSGLGPKWQKYLWWKKYLTSFQIIQFAFGLGIVVLICMTRSECPNYFKRSVFLYYTTLYIISLFVMFSIFYNKSYSSKRTFKDKTTAGKIE